MKKLLLLLFLSTFSFAQQQWRALGPDDFNQTSFYYSSFSDSAIDSDGNIYTAFQDESNDFKTAVRKFDGEKWTQVGSSGISDGNGQLQSIVVDDNNSIFIAYNDLANSRVTVEKFNGNDWEVVGVTNISIGNCTNISLEIDNLNILHIAYSDIGDSDNIYVKRLVGANWQQIGGIVGKTVQGPSQNSVSLCFDINNIPIVGFSDKNNGERVNVKKLNNQNWEVLGVNNFTETSARGVTLKFDQNNDLYLSYVPNSSVAIVKKLEGLNWIDISTSNVSIGNSIYAIFNISSTNELYMVHKDQANENYQLIYIKKFNGSSWEYLDSFGIPIGTGNPHSLIFDSNNNPIVTFKDFDRGNKLSVKKYNNTEWDLLGTAGISGKSLTSFVSCEKNNIPYVFYSTGESPIKSVKRYVNSNWEFVGEQNTEDIVSSSFSIVVDSNNIIYIAYRDSNVNSENLTVKKYDSGAWSTILSVNNEYPYISFVPKLLIDNNNVLHLITRINDVFKIRKYVNSSWQTLPNSSFDYNVSYFNALFDLNNSLIIAYTNSLSPSQTYIKKYLNPGWQTLGFFNETLTNGGTIPRQIDVDNDNNLYYCYRIMSESKIYIRKLVGLDWINIGGFIQNSSVTNPVFKIHNNSPYVLFSENIDIYNIERLTLKTLVASTYWGTVGVSGFSAERVGYAELGFINNTPFSIYNSLGLFGKYFGDENTLTLNEQYLSGNEIKVYPNPIQDEFRISLDQGSLQKIEIYSLDGKKVFESNRSLEKINISSLLKGIYVLKVKSIQKEYVVKIIKE